jgi:hypothetical protein
MCILSGVEGQSGSIDREENVDMSPCDCDRAVRGIWPCTSSSSLFEDGEVG